MRGNPYRRLAAEVVLDAVRTVKSRRPPGRFHCDDDSSYGLRVRRWREQQENDLEWFADPSRSRGWIEAAGLEWEVVVGGLRRRKWLAA